MTLAFRTSPIKFAIILVSSVVILISCGSGGKVSAEDYDGKISYSFDAFNQKFMEYSLSLRNVNIQEQEILRLNTLTIAQNFIDSAKNLSAYENDESLLNAYRNYLNTVRYSIKFNDSLKFNILSKDSLLDDREKKLLKELTSSSLLSCDKAYLEFQNTQKKFRQKNGIIRK